MPGVYYVIIVMKNKILILLMSCNQPLYESEEQACRETFLVDAEREGIQYYFYKGINEGHSAQTIDTEKNTMYLDVSDKLNGTALKTIAALKESLSLEWDYVVKTNVSTYLNIANIREAVNSWEGSGDTNIYGSRYLVNKYSMHVPFPRGNFIILSRSLVEQSLPYAEVLSKGSDLPHTDDTLIGLSLLFYITKFTDTPYLTRIKEVPSIVSWRDDILDAPDFNEALSIRCKDELNKERTPENLKKIHGYYHGDRPPKNYRRKVEVVETGNGPMTYETYTRALAIAKKKASQEPSDKDDVKKQG